MNILRRAVYFKKRKRNTFLLIKSYVGVKKEVTYLKTEKEVEEGQKKTIKDGTKIFVKKKATESKTVLVRFKFDCLHTVY